MVRSIEAISSLIDSNPSKLHLLQIHAHLIRSSLTQVPTIFTKFLSRVALSPLLYLNYSLRFITQITNPSAYHYNTMIRAYSQSDFPTESFDFYNQMRGRGVRPNSFTSSFILKSIIQISSLIGGKQIHSRMFQDGHQSDCQSITTLMSFYASCEKGADACKVFDEMPQPDTVAWNVLISCYANGGRSRDALGLFDAMRHSGHGSKPDEITCILLLRACAHLGALSFGECVHRYIDENGYGNVLNLQNSLIAMYSKCGNLDRAFQIFQQMTERNVVTWSAMISGMAMNGNGKDAMEAFKEMQRIGIRPDDQTLTGVLSACRHGRLVDEGLRLLERMEMEFGLEPNIYHYGCIVDLLGRAGLLDQAYKLINSMRVEPDATIWRTLLGACRIYGDFALGELVIGHLIELKAQEAGDYVLLLNIYASIGNWKKVADVRKLVKEKGIQTTPGCSTIELNHEIHELGVDDKSHPRKEKIYEKLNEIEQQLKIAGYVAEISSELHNMDSKDKGDALSCHSEKLAIALGILSTPHGATIRVANNLRICIDCHHFTKMLSSVYSRKVIIRDRNRFHHFQQGHCSCNDYW